LSVEKKPYATSIVMPCSALGSQTVDQQGKVDFSPRRADSSSNRPPGSHVIFEDHFGFVQQALRSAWIFRRPRSRM
jgi:hypothetical protein